MTPVPIFQTKLEGGKPIAHKPILRESVESRHKGLKTRAKNRKLRKRKSR